MSVPALERRPPNMVKGIISRGDAIVAVSALWKMLEMKYPKEAEH